MKDITLFMPAYNSESTIVRTLESIEKQKTDKIDKIIILDDGSKDNTKILIRDFKKKSKFDIELRENNKPSGLAYKYNHILREIKTKYLLIIHADIVIEQHDAIEKYYNAINNSAGTIAVVSVCKGSFEDWLTYNFWQKCEFNSLMGSTLRYSGLPDSKGPFLFGKFDFFDVEKLKSIGGFNEKYYIAGEDTDLERRLNKINGKKIVLDVSYVHIHYLDKKYTLGTFLKRSFRYSNGAGVIAKDYFGKKETIFLWTRSFLSVLFFLSILLLCYSILPLIIFLLLFIYFTYKSTNLIYKYAYNNYRIILIPFVFIFLMLGSSYRFMKGLILNKQSSR